MWKRETGWVDTYALTHSRSSQGQQNGTSGLLHLISKPSSGSLTSQSGRRGMRVGPAPPDILCPGTWASCGFVALLFCVLEKGLKGHVRSQLSSM